MFLGSLTAANALLFTEPCSFNSLIREVVILLHSTFRNTSLGVKTLTRTHLFVDASLAVTVRVALCPLPEGSFLALPFEDFLLGSPGLLFPAFELLLHADPFINRYNSSVVHSSNTLIPRLSLS
ncbi:hypothetical protein PEX1_053700 [Penicillium expansum]|uniref:Uncharacterized protein n=1 Tax=Penicillium expansum TaxID=27334 RepID=A0A0A2IB99_PENEN|nr:hypothetical protein PEX2_089380 [Penicillium expansum]KGO40382.1 hypothetical protein PEXP_031970 [Penicillium expansum]KGO50785.1 hypothetical protein PEX1_053700 [Penicillium expansum]KGO54953.1 hypothetical protein PEX2_089380 [Penicillium expansum]